MLVDREKESKIGPIRRNRTFDDVLFAIIVLPTTDFKKGYYT